MEFMNKEILTTIAQSIGIFAMAFNILSYQGKKRNSIIAFQLIGCLLFSVNFFMLGATMGGILNAVAVIRAILFLYKDKLKTHKIGWLYGFIAVYIIAYISNFTLFSKAATIENLLVEFLPVIGMTALSIGFRFENASQIRKMGLISSPAWLIYNIIVLSYGAIICESLSLISIFVGMLRHDKEK